MRLFLMQIILQSVTILLSSVLVLALPKPSGNGEGSGSSGSVSNPPSSPSSPPPPPPQPQHLDPRVHLLYEARSPYALNLPARAHGPFKVPFAREKLAAFDYSLPPMHRYPDDPVEEAITLDPATRAKYEGKMRAYHRELLADDYVVRPMEVDHPPLQLNADNEYDRRVSDAEDHLEHNGWLLSGPQVAMLKNAQVKIRGLSVFEVDDIYNDHPENAVLRSRLDRILKQPAKFGIYNFPQALHAAIFETWHESERAQDPNFDKKEIDRDWLEAFPFLGDRNIDVAYFLLNH